MDIVDVSRPLRHAIVRTLAPNVWRNANCKLPSDATPRPTILYAKALFGMQPCVVVEIGSCIGENAESILETLNVKTLYLVDPYEPYIQGKNLVLVNGNSEIAQRKMKKYGERVQFIKRKSAEAASVLPNNLDLVYIDGNHDYDYVKQDIELYYPKLRLNGIIGGHDFRNGGGDVIRAVCEFAVSHKCDLKHDNCDWWAVKEATRDLM